VLVFPYGHDSQADTYLYRGKEKPQTQKPGLRYPFFHPSDAAENAPSVVLGTTGCELWKCGLSRTLSRECIPTPTLMWVQFWTTVPCN
jgi:hypothetical protein